MELKFELIPHPAFPPSAVRSVNVELTATDWDDVLLDYRIEGGQVVIPEWQSPARVDGLWRSTCFEIFFKIPDLESYYEYNFSPSGQWAAYAFDRHRLGMRDLELDVEPHVEVDPDQPMFLRVDLNLSDTPNVPMLASLSAVIEEQDGTMSYWALAHPLGGEPDFHHPDCFVLNIPAATHS